ncbi:hypothetical protein JCM18899A_08660 [Nocardioides sp. AN3]
MDLDDGVVDVEQRVPAVHGAHSAARLAVLAEVPSSVASPSQRGQEPRGDRIDLADVTEGERVSIMKTAVVPRSV